MNHPPRYSRTPTRSRRYRFACVLAIGVGHATAIVGSRAVTTDPGAIALATPLALAVVARSASRRSSGVDQRVVREALIV
jgi:hypothetical protein